MLLLRGTHRACTLQVHCGWFLALNLDITVHAGEQGPSHIHPHGVAHGAPLLQHN